MSRTFLVAAFTWLLAAVAIPAQADSGEEAEFVALINQSRAAAGLGQLAVEADLVDDARRHTSEMIVRGTIFHSTTAELSAVTTGWSLLGENVGMGPNPPVLHDAFLASASHKANILGDFGFVGVGAERAPNGTLFVTVLFMRREAPPPTTTTTTAPPPTTTTTPSPPPATAGTAATSTTPTTIGPGGAEPSAPTEVAAATTRPGRMAAWPAGWLRWHGVADPWWPDGCPGHLWRHGVCVS